jgi:hypothetical protein
MIALLALRIGARSSIGSARAALRYRTELSSPASGAKGIERVALKPPPRSSALIFTIPIGKRRPLSTPPSIHSPALIHDAYVFAGAPATVQVAFALLRPIESGIVYCVG